MFHIFFAYSSIYYEDMQVMLKHICNFLKKVNNIPNLTFFHGIYLSCKLYPNVVIESKQVHLRVLQLNTDL